MVDWCQKVIGFLAFALLVPQASQAGSCAEFPGFCLLMSSDVKSVMEAGFCFSLMV